MFDPYRRWLGIPPKDQPPNHYRLLGLELFENDLDLIEGAADKQMGFVRQYQSGEHATHAAKLLNELANARLCLLKPATKTAYDAKLRQELAPPEPEFPELPFSTDEHVPERNSQRKRKQKASGSKASSSPQPLMIGGGIAVVLVGIITVFLLSGRSQPQIETPADSDSVAATGTANTNIAEATPTSPIATPPEPTVTNDPEAGESPKNSSGGVPTTSPPDAPLAAVPASTNANAGKPVPGAVTNPSVGPSVSQTLQPGDWIDLLDWADGVDWAARGINWNDGLEGKPTREGITLKSREYNHFPLPAIIDGDYELQVEFTRTAGSDGGVGLFFPIGLHNMQLEIGSRAGSISGVGWIDGKWFDENPTGRKPSTVSNNQRHQIAVRVRNDGERAAFNIDWDQTRDFIAWEGPSTSLINREADGPKVSLTRHPWLQCSAGQVTFHAVRVRMLSGTIRRDVITQEDREQDLMAGFVRLVGERANGTSGVAWKFVVNQIPLESGGPERHWPLIAREFKFCSDFYGAHAPSRLKCPIPSGAKSFSVIGYNDSSRSAAFQVFINGNKAYDSGETSMAIIKVDIPAKSSLMELVVDPGKDSSYDHAYWCYPRFHAATADRVADKMLDGKPGPLKFRVASGTAEHGLVHDRPIGPLKSVPVHFRDIQPCDEFLLAHAPSTVTYQVPEGMSRFTAIGYNVFSHSVKFEVWADAKRVYESTEAGIISIDAKLPPGTRTIELKINDLGNPLGDAGIWCYPRLHRK